MKNDPLWFLGAIVAAIAVGVILWMAYRPAYTDLPAETPDVIDVGTTTISTTTLKG